MTETLMQRGCYP